MTKTQMKRLYQLVPDYFESEWMMRRYFELFAKGKPKDKVVDEFINFIKRVK